MPRLLDPFRLLALLSLITMATASDAENASSTADAGAAPASASTQRPPLRSRSDIMTSDLLRQLPDKEVVSLKAGTDDFAALWRPANVGEPRGVIILLPGEGESADWPRGIGPLRRGLPDHGWHTLSLSLPDSPGPALPAVANTSEGAAEPPVEAPAAETEQVAENPVPSEAGYLPEETAAIPSELVSDDTKTEETVAPAAPHADQITERIEAALSFARSKQPAAIVLLGQGTGGYWAARYLQHVAPSDVRHLGVIQPRQPEGQDEPLVQLIPTLKLATADFYYKNGRGDPTAARERLKTSRRIQHPAYRQVGLPPQTGNSQADQEQLLRRIRGWLDNQT